MFYWATLPGMQLTGVMFTSRYSSVHFETCVGLCKRSSWCQSFDQNNETDVCRLYNMRHVPQLLPYEVEPNNETSYTYRLCVAG
jgi:hypothetical protein